MTSTKGFTGKDNKTFQELLIKANALQLGGMILSINKEIQKRVNKEKYRMDEGRE